MCMHHSARWPKQGPRRHWPDAAQAASCKSHAGHNDWSSTDRSQYAAADGHGNAVIAGRSIEQRRADGFVAIKDSSNSITESKSERASKADSKHQWT
ncbi:hypothetical protein E4U54_002245, partial [Claviceps lovelessii]